MKKNLTLFVAILAMTFFTSSVKAQFNPYAENTKMISAGVGISGWGVPIYGRAMFPVAENLTVGGGLSYQSYGYSSNWNLSIVGISARGNYHFNELIEIDDDWDFYAGLALNYYVTSYNYKGPGSSNWNSGGPDGLGLGLHVGGHYFVSDKLGINAELGGGSALSGALIGVTFLL